MPLDGVRHFVRKDYRKAVLTVSVRSFSQLLRNFPQEWRHSMNLRRRGVQGFSAESAVLSSRESFVVLPRFRSSYHLD